VAENSASGKIICIVVIKTRVENILLKKSRTDETEMENLLTRTNIPSETISTMSYVVDTVVSSLSKTVDVDMVPVDDNMLK
jgi:hypothetical protein